MCVRGRESPASPGVCCLRDYFQGGLELLLSLLGGPLVSSLRKLLLAGCANSCIYTPGERRRRAGTGSLSFNQRKTSLVEKPMSSSGGSGSGPYTSVLVSSPSRVWGFGNLGTPRHQGYFPPSLLRFSWGWRMRGCCWASYSCDFRILKASPQFPSAPFHPTPNSHFLYSFWGLGLWPVSF